MGGLMFWLYDPKKRIVKFLIRLSDCHRFQTCFKNSLIENYDRGAKLAEFVIVNNLNI